MKIIVNKTHGALRVPLPHGKVLRPGVEALWAADAHTNYLEEALPDEGLARTQAALEAFYFTRSNDASTLYAHAAFEVTSEPVQDHLLTPVSGAKRAELQTVVEGRSR